jgi:GTP diphosphokinase / guanosine-3',5'-bis(diphosphate) 3'-diphosphatase
MTYDDLAEKIKYLNSTDQKLIRRAFDFATKAHEGQKRVTGEPYISHGLETAYFVANLKLDVQAICAALLHDVCEDTKCDVNTIRREFGRDITNIVDGVTKLDKIKITHRYVFLTTKEKMPEFDRQVETLRKMFMAMSNDIRVVIIKLADRYHNMKTLNSLPEEKRFRISRETIEIYAPLAYRLGMGNLKGDLEDLAFPYVYPKEYEELKSKVANRLQEKERYIDKLKKILIKNLYKSGIKCEIHGRTKHMYSLWRKLQRYNNDLNQIYDLVALRIIVNDIEDCYKVLGNIHNMWKPLVGRIKDYIAAPKPNGYQSIHTTVFAPEGEIVEIQIRTKKMHDQAEYGIAAHWHYSEKKNTMDYILRKTSRVPRGELVWVKELAKWQKALSDNEEVATGLHADFFSDRIFVYTPTGEVKNLPAGATPVDFAYAVHTDIGHHFGGAKVNGKIVEISYPLQNGDICDIITKKNARPKYDWLEFAKTSLARGKIKSATRNKKP